MAKRKMRVKLPVQYRGPLMGDVRQENDNYIATVYIEIGFVESPAKKARKKR